MKKCKKLLSGLLAALLLVGAVPAYAANGSGGLNGDHGDVNSFDYSRYDATVEINEMAGSTASGKTITFYAKDDFKWPDGQVILIKVTGSAWNKDVLDCISAPDGRTVDVYEFDLFGGNTYTLWAHYGASVTKPSAPDKPAAYTHSYGDVKPGDWYYDAVMTMTEGGLLAGYPDGKFGPNDTITLGQFQLIIARLQKSPNTDYFASVLSRPDKQVPMTRGKTARTLANYLTAPSLSSGTFIWTSLTDAEYELAVKTHAHVTCDKFVNNHTIKYAMIEREYEFWKASLNTGIDYHASIDEFPDGDAIWQYCCDHPTPIDGTVEEQRADAVTGILRAWNYGIFRGDASGNFNAADTLTRAQLCQVLYNMGWTQAGDFK